MRNFIHKFLDLVKRLSIGTVFFLSSTIIKCLSFKVFIIFIVTSLVINIFIYYRMNTIHFSLIY